MIAVSYYTDKRKFNPYKEIYVFASSLAGRDTSVSKFAKEEMLLPSDFKEGIHKSYKGICIAIPLLDEKNQEVDEEVIKAKLIDLINIVSVNLDGKSGIFITDLSLDGRIDENKVYPILLELVKEFNSETMDDYYNRLFLISEQFKPKNKNSIPRQLPGYTYRIIYFF